MKFRNKILVCAILFFSFFFGIGGSILISASFRSNLSREKQAAVNSYQMVLNMMRVVNSVSTQSDYTDVVNTLKQLADNGGGSWAALRLTDGSNVIYKSAPEAAFIKELASQTEEGRSVLQIFQEDNVYYLQITGALEAGNKMLYLDGLYDVTGIYDARNAQQAIYRYVFGIALGSAFLVFWLMARFLTRPLRELSEAAREITEGNLTRRAVIYSNDEVGSLAGDFNRMTEKLSEHIEKLEDTMERQESFMGSFAHELKTPMTSIIGYADLIRSQDLTREEQREAANYIRGEKTGKSVPETAGSACLKARADPDRMLRSRQSGKRGSVHSGAGLSKSRNPYPGGMPARRVPAGTEPCHVAAAQSFGQRKKGYGRTRNDPYPVRYDAGRLQDPDRG